MDRSTPVKANDRGYRLTVGSDYAVSVVGRLLGTRGEANTP